MSPGPDTNWDRKTWRLAGPIMLTNISLPLLGAVDTAVVGRLPGPEYLGAVAISALVFHFIYFGFNFLRMGTTGLTAQSIGARDPDQVRAWLARAVILATGLGGLLIAVQVPLAVAAFDLLSPSEQVRPLAEAYYSVRIWGAPAALLNMAMLGWFFGIQNTRAALVTQVAMNGVNIVLDIWFVLGLGWGVEGVAWATVISEVGAVAFGGWLVARNLKRVGGTWDVPRVLNVKRFGHMIRVNRDIFLRSLSLQVTLATFTAIGARLGDTTLAANAVLLNFQMFMSHGLDGFANAAEAMVGEAVGARDRKYFRDAVRATGRWALIFAVGFVAVYGLAGNGIIDLLTTVETVRASAREYLAWNILLPAVSVWSFQLDGVFIGSTRTSDMRNGMFLSLVVFFAAVALLVPSFGNHGLWAAFTAFMAMRGVTLGMWYPRLERSVGSSDKT